MNHLLRCNVGGQETCKVTCIAQGFETGRCDANDNCNCGGGNNDWGDLIDGAGDVVGDVGDFFEDLF